MFIDYAGPLMVAEKALKNTYALLLLGKDEEAILEAKQVLEATAEAIAAIRVQQVKSTEKV